MNLYMFLCLWVLFIDMSGYVSFISDKLFSSHKKIVLGPNFIYTA